MPLSNVDRARGRTCRDLALAFALGACSPAPTSGPVATDPAHADTCADAAANVVETPAEAGAAGATTPQIFFQYSFTIDDVCAPLTSPETLSDWQRALIGKIPVYRSALEARLPSFQKAWDESARDLLPATAVEAKHAWTRREYDAALYFCPRVPSMGTPLGINVVSYLQEAVPDIPALIDLDGDGKRDPLPTSLFVAITYHEVLHKYLAELDVTTKSDVLDKLPATFDGLTPRDVLLLRVHLHLFALRRSVYEKLGLAKEFPWVAAQEAGYGAGYTKAWQMVHDGDAYYLPLLEEIRRAKSVAPGRSTPPPNP